MSTPSNRAIEWSEVAKHDSIDDCWIVIHNCVIDATKYLNDHPGGPLVISNRAGKDATKKFIAASHSENAQKKLSTFQVGVIAKDSIPSPEQLDTSGSLAQQLAGVAFLGILVALLLYHFFQNKQTTQ